MKHLPLALAFFAMEVIGFVAGYRWRARQELPCPQVIIPDHHHIPVQHGPNWPSRDKYGNWEAEKS